MKNFSLLLSLLSPFFFYEGVVVLGGFGGGKVMGIHDLKPLAKLIERDKRNHDTCTTGV